MKPPAKLLGLAFSGVCLVYFIVAARRILANTNISWSDSTALHAFPVAAVLYLAAYVALALAWHLLLRAVGVDAKLPRSVGVYLSTQIAKYLPGNVGQHIGRVYLSSADGLPGMRVGIGVALEVLLVIIASGVLSLPLAHLIVEQLRARPPSIYTVAAVLALLAAMIGTARVLRRSQFVSALEGHLISGLRDVLDAKGRRYFMGAFLLVLLGMTLAGGSLATMALSSNVDVTLAAIMMSVAVFSGAWIAGFLALGAPAGLGVREAILLGGLTPTLGAGRAVEVAVLFRALSVMADIVAFSVGWLLLRGTTHDS